MLFLFYYQQLTGIRVSKFTQVAAVLLIQSWGRGWGSPVRKRFIPHQTRKRIEKLVAAGRTELDEETGYSTSELDGYESLFELIASRTGEHPGETDAEARQRNI